MSATSTMTSHCQSWRHGPRITTKGRQQSPPSSPCTPSSPSSPRWGEDRRPLSWTECKVGKVVYLPAQEEIAANSRILRQTFGGRKWEHPAVITKVDEIKGFVEIMVATSNGNQGILSSYPGNTKSDIDRRRTHVLIAPKDDPNDAGKYNNPDQVMPSLVLTADSDDFRKTCYLRIAHTYHIEPEILRKYDRSITLTPESMLALQNAPKVRAPKGTSKRAWGSHSSAPSSSSSSESDSDKPVAKKVATTISQPLNPISNPWRKPLISRSEEDLSWTTVVKKTTRSPSPLPAPTPNVWRKFRVGGNAIAVA